MSSPGANIVAIARCWRGTPYARGVASVGVGADCAGFVAGVLFGRGEPRELSRRLSRLSFVSDNLMDGQAQAGDVIAFTGIRGKGAPVHVGVLSRAVRGEVPRFIHADVGGVVEQLMNDAWRRRVHSVWRNGIEKPLPSVREVQFS
jgi:cell wall-associated NlpC family hydrolase